MKRTTTVSWCAGSAIALLLVASAVADLVVFDPATLEAGDGDGEVRFADSSSPAGRFGVYSRQLFDRVIEIDPEFAGGYAGIAWSYALPVVFNTAKNPDEHLVISMKFAREAVEVDPRFGAGYVVLAFAQVLSGEKACILKSTLLRK